jgi:hypothetical protein
MTTTTTLLDGTDPSLITDPTITTDTDSTSTTDPTLASLSITTDQSDYAPGSTATFTVDDVNAGDTLTFLVTDLNGLPISVTNQLWTATADTSGQVQTTWGVGQDALGQAFQVTVVDQTTGQVATTTFTDGQASLNVNQWEDIGHGSTPTTPEWTNGDLHPTNSDYAEGNSVPFRMDMTGLSTAKTYSITIDYESLKGVDHAYDYLTAYNASLPGGASPLPSNWPLDGTGAGSFTDHPVTFSQPVGPDGQFDIWGGTIIGVVEDGVSNGGNDQLTELTVTFTADDSEAVVAWGGHLAVTGTDPTTGLPDPTYLGASNISGGPFHMYVVDSAKDFSGGGQLSIHDVAGSGPGPGPGSTPAIDIEKLVSLDGGTTWNYHDDGTGTEESAALIAAEYDTATGGNLTAANFVSYGATPPSALSAHDPEYLFLVTNTGTADLQGVTLSDTAYSGLGLTLPSSTLAVGASEAKVITDLSVDVSPAVAWSAGPNSDTATVTAQSADPSSPGTVTDSDSVAYFGATPGITVDKELASNSQPWVEVGSGLPASAPVVLVGETVNFQAIIDNTTTGGLGVTGLTVIDDNGSVYTGANDGPAFSGAATSLGSLGTTTATASTAAVAGLQQDTVTVAGTVTDSFGNTANVSATDSADYFGATAGINIEKLVSVDYNSTNPNLAHWYLLSDDTASAAELADLAAIQAYAGFHGSVQIGTPVTLAGASVNYEVFVTNTSDGGLAETGITVTDTSNTSLNFTEGSSLASGASELSNVLTVTANGSDTSTTNTVQVTGTVTDSFGNSASPSDTDSAAYTGLHLSLPGLTKGFWAQHLQVWDVAHGDDGSWTQQLYSSNPQVISQSTDLNPSPTFDWNHSGGITTDAVNSSGQVTGAGDSGLLLGDLNHDGMANDGTGPDLFFDLASAQALINSGTSTTDARQILGSQALAAQLNEYNDLVHDQHNGHGGLAAGYDASPTGLIEDSVQWLLGQGSFSPHTLTTPGHSNVDTNTANDLGMPAPTVINDGLGNDYSIKSGVITLGTGNGGIVLSNSSDPSWHTFAEIMNASNTPITYTDLLIGDSHYGQTFNVYADGEGLKNALQAYNQGQLVVSDDGSKIGWSADGGHTVNDVHDNTAGAFWGILEDQNLAHGATTVVGVHN